VPVGAGGDDADVVRVLDSGDDACGEDELFPCLADVDDVNAYPSVRSSDNLSNVNEKGQLTVIPPLPDVRLHLLIAVFRSDVTLGG
jgi:hypothetical protein